LPENVFADGANARPFAVRQADEFFRRGILDALLLKVSRSRSLRIPSCRW
jgi:hypothetical protein